MATSKRTPLDDAVQHAANGERVRVRQNGNEAVVVPVEDAALLEAIEDYIDVKDVPAAAPRPREQAQSPFRGRKPRENCARRK